MQKAMFLLVLYSASLALSAQCKTISPTTLDCTLMGPLVSGGVGADFGFQDKKDAWGSISSEPVPAGYVLLTVYFSLEGPHPCNGQVWSNPWPHDSNAHKLIGIVNLPHADIGTGSYAQCQQVSQTSTSVTWKYQFQGWTAERRSGGIDNQGAPYIKYDEHIESIKERATLHTIWVNDPN